jgi:hypothetical protein
VDRTYIRIRQRLVVIAATISIALCQHAQGAFVTYSIGGGEETVNVTWDGITANALAGGIVLTKVSGDAGMPNTIFTVGTDIGGTLSLGYTYGYSASTPFAGQSGLKPTWGAGNASSLSSPANAAAAIQAAAHLFYTHKGVLDGGSTSEKAALQIAVWEALYDTGDSYGLNGGRFRVNTGNSEAMTLASTWLTGLNLGDNYYSGNLLKPDPAQQWGAFGQEVFFDVAPVPEPATLIAGALLLAPLLTSVVRSLRKK